MMNIHQVVENCRYLENVVENQAEQLKAQTEAIEKLERNMETLIAADNDKKAFALKRTTRISRGVPHPSLPESPSMCAELTDWKWSMNCERMRASLELCGNN
jgi:uncharacterized protein (DUF2344 family)